MNCQKAIAFLRRHGMEPERVHPAEDAAKMAAEMERGLCGQGGSLPMIPTYLSDSGALPQGRSVAVIDAGGTNFRSALLRFENGQVLVEGLRKQKMPGIERPVSWEEFISFTADQVEPFMDRTDRIGFCFSYSADITPEMDGKVGKIDKEVVITGCEGQLVGVSLTEELARRGYPGKKCLIINDTVAVLLGGMAQQGLSGQKVIGQVSGTGTNTCCALPVSRIEKLHRDGERRMIVNLEAGMYTGVPGGDFDRQLDAESKNAGRKHFEKLTAGVYLGELCRLMLRSAGEEGLLAPESREKVQALGRIDSAVIDAWAAGENLEQVCQGEEDAAFVRCLCKAVFERSARCMCLNLAAILLLTGDEEAVVCAEGSLVQKGRSYRPVLERLIREEIEGKLGKKLRLIVTEDTTLPGSAAAALLNL